MQRKKLRNGCGKMNDSAMDRDSSSSVEKRRSASFRPSSGVRRIERKRPGFRFMIHVVNAHRAAHRRLECDPLRDSGCIDRQQKGIVAKRSGEIHRPQVGAAKSVVKLVALNNAWWPAAALPS